LDSTLTALAAILGTTASKLNTLEAGYLIGTIYTAIIPSELRSEKGVYFTPPALTNRLLNGVEEEGVKWNEVTVLDPACGGGAFLAPVALRMITALHDNDPHAIIQFVESHLKGYEIDFFSAWLSQVFLEIVLSKYAVASKKRIKNLIEVCDTLSKNEDEKFNVIIGNPPFGKIKLDDFIRSKFKESLYGHANLYGLFTHKALLQLKKAGVLAYVTPTSFLAGEYFKNLRKMLTTVASPKNIDFVILRKGIFEDVLQETMLATYRLGEKAFGVKVNEIHPEPGQPLEINGLGTFKLPADPSAGWILPRTGEQSKWVHALERMEYTLKDWGYEVKTGPLVWNRHKNQLSDFEGKNTYPLIWAESISADGKFSWKADKQNHTLFFNFKEGDAWLVSDYPCLLLQRTTAKEQQRRLIAAMLPQKFIKQYRGVVIENHINMLKPIDGKPPVSLKLLHTFMNSLAADTAFRCISGSVAVSAYELESMPLPSLGSMKKIQKLVDGGADHNKIEAALLKLYK
jgi:adenine-specific DNA-methyltransferase